jgi:hypothetical protein
MKGGADFSVGVPSLEVVSRYGVAPEGIIPEGGIGTQSVAHFGELVDDLLLLTRRSSFYLNPFSVNDNLFLAVPAMICCPDSGGTSLEGTTSSIHGWTFASYLSSAYLGENGGWNYMYADRSGESVCTAAQTPIGAGFANTAVSALRSFTPGGSILPGFSDNKGYGTEVRIPDRNPYLFRYTRQVFAIGIVADSMVLIPEDLTSDSLSYDIWVGAADDFTVGGYLAPPMLFLLE